MIIFYLFFLSKKDDGEQKQWEGTQIFQSKISPFFPVSSRIFPVHFFLFLSTIFAPDFWANDKETFFSSSFF